MGNFLGKNKTLPKNAAIIEIRSWVGTVEETILLKGKEIKPTGRELYDVISEKSKLLKKRKYLLREPETEVLFILSKDQKSTKQTVPFSSTKFPDIIGERCCVLVDANLPVPSQSLTFNGPREICFLQETQKKLVRYFV